jgi:hypothetical protein
MRLMSAQATGPGAAPAPAAAEASRASRWVRARRLLRSPRVIIGELLAIAAAGVLLTVVPQATDREGTAQLEHFSRGLTAVVRALDLDRLVHSPWFLAAVSLTVASLINVLVEMWRRAWRESREVLSEASFRSTPLRRVLERAAGGPLPLGGFRSSGRAGPWGTPLFHGGLVVVVLAGLGRALFASEAAVELIEGETLSATSEGWSNEAHGPLGSAFALPEALTLESVTPTHYASGKLAGLGVAVSAGERRATLAINQPLDFGSKRLYLLAPNGPAVLLRLHGEAGEEATMLPLRHVGDVFEGTQLSGTLVLRLRGRLGPRGELPEAIEVRALRGGALLWVGALAPGQTAALSPGESLELAGVRRWATFQGAEDFSQYVAYLGFALMILGALLIFTVTRVDTAVVPISTPEGERLLVALRAHRHAPAYAERFERLVAEVSGPHSPGGGVLRKP